MTNKGKKTVPRFAYQRADMREFNVKFTNKELGNVLLLLDACKEHLEMDLNVDRFINEAIAFYFDTLNRAVARNIQVKQQQAAEGAAKDDSTGTEDTAGNGEQPSETVSAGALADENQSNSQTTGTEG